MDNDNNNNEYNNFKIQLSLVLEDEEMLKKLKKIWKNWHKQKKDNTKPTNNSYNDAELLKYRRENQQIKTDLEEYKEAISDNARVIRNLEDEKSRYSSELSDKNRTIQTLNTKIDGLQKDNLQVKDLERQISTLKEQKSQMEAENRKLKERFADLEAVYQLYLSLPTDNKNSLKSIFKGDTLEEFIFCGVQYDNVESLWDYIKNEAINGHDIKPLQRIFDCFFKAYNTNYEPPLYQKTTTACGETFDTSQHIRGAGSSVSGEIKEVVLQGYENTRTGKLIKQSVVRM